jgi:hypothetical protein
MRVFGGVPYLVPVGCAVPLLSTPRTDDRSQLTFCVNATDCREDGRSWRSGSEAFRMMETGHFDNFLHCIGRSMPAPRSATAGMLTGKRP